jgi:hypothetical protein
VRLAFQYVQEQPADKLKEAQQAIGNVLSQSRDLSLKCLEDCRRQVLDILEQAVAANSLSSPDMVKILSNQRMTKALNTLSRNAGIVGSFRLPTSSACDALGEDTKLIANAIKGHSSDAKQYQDFAGAAIVCVETFAQMKDSCSADQLRIFFGKHMKMREISVGFHTTTGLELSKGFVEKFDEAYDASSLALPIFQSQAKIFFQCVLNVLVLLEAAKPEAEIVTAIKELHESEHYAQQMVRWSTDSKRDTCEMQIFSKVCRLLSSYKIPVTLKQLLDSAAKAGAKSAKKPLHALASAFANAETHFVVASLGEVSGLNLEKMLQRRCGAEVNVEPLVGSALALAAVAAPALALAADAGGVDADASALALAAAAAPAAALPKVAKTICDMNNLVPRLE